MTLAEFKEKTKNLPDDTEIYLRTANFSGEYLSDNPCSEMKMLDKLMNSFALEETSEYSADGTLLDSKVEIDAERLFRKPVTFQTYRVQSGDTISGITKKFGLPH